MPLLASPQVFAHNLPLINHTPLSFTDITLWQSMPSFYKKWTSGGKGWLPCEGNISIYPLLHQFQLPCHSQVELSSFNGLKAWGEGQKLCHDIAFLLVQAEDEATGARNYGLSTIWVNHSQARVPSVEEVVGKLTAYASSRPNWPNAMV